VLLISCAAIATLLGAWTWHARRTADPAYDGDHLPAKTVDDPVSADAASVDLIGATDFHFTFGDGSGWHGFNVVKVGPDGRCEYTFFTYGNSDDPETPALRVQKWRRAGFTLDPRTLAALRKRLADIDFFRLKKAYHANVYDGTQRFAKVEASGKRKGVYCDNHFPLPFQRPHAFVNERIIAVHPTEIAAAKPIQLEREDWERESFD
jgi:hypothetical protein